RDDDAQRNSEHGDEQHVLRPACRIRGSEHPPRASGPEVLRAQLRGGQTPCTLEDVAVPGFQARRTEVSVAGERRRSRRTDRSAAREGAILSPLLARGVRCWVATEAAWTGTMISRSDSGRRLA